MKDQVFAVPETGRKEKTSYCCLCGLLLGIGGLRIPSMLKRQFGVTRLGTLEHIVHGDETGGDIVFANFDPVCGTLSSGARREGCAGGGYLRHAVRAIARWIR